MTERRRPTKADLASASGKAVPDLIAPGLRVLFVGINPSLYSAAVGHHFARPGNRFWPTLFGAGFSRRQLSPYEEHELLAEGFGITNLVERATARADELAPDELRAGIDRLARKIRRYRVRTVAFLGMTAFCIAFGRKRAEIGLQPGERFAGAAVWVLPNPSGLNAHYQLPDFVRLFSELRAAVV